MRIDQTGKVDFDHQLGRVGGLPFSRLQALLRDGVFALHTGPLVSRIQSSMPDVVRSVHTLYAHHPYSVDPEFSDFHVQVRRPRNLRRLLKRQVEFVVDGDRPFEPLPADQAPAFLEWGLNWLIAASCHQWLTIHAASLERNGSVVILPAPPGSGKSTLCAALASRNWRLLSDELTLIDRKTSLAHALARPINLKNASIELIRNFEPSSAWGPVVYDTSKGQVTHLRPPRDSVDRMDEPAPVRWIVFPRYERNAAPELTPRGKAQTFLHFAQNSFNYTPLGSVGFEVTGDLVTRSECYDFVYSRLDDAIEVFDWLVSDAGRDHP